MVGRNPDRRHTLWNISDNHRIRTDFGSGTNGDWSDHLGAGTDMDPGLDARSLEVARS